MEHSIEAIFVVISFVAVWVVNKIFELGNSMYKDNNSSLGKAIEEAKATRAFEHSTSDFEHKEIENLTVIYLQNVVSMVSEVPLHKVH